MNANKEALVQAFTELQRITTENYQVLCGMAKKYRSDYEENERVFRARMIEIINQNFAGQIAQEENATAKEALEVKKRTEIVKVILESDARINASKKIITDKEKRNLMRN